MVKRLFLASCLWAVALASGVQAQSSDTPRFGADGNFFSALVQGPRGRYPHWQWLVIDPDQAGLNCRSGSGAVVVTLVYGAVVDSVFDGGDAIELRDGQPWLKVEASLLDIQRRVVDRRAETYICYVRANTQYVAPINPDTQ